MRFGGALVAQETLAKSQLRRSTDSRQVKSRHMNAPVILLLTNDAGLEDCVAQALLEIGGVSHLTDNAGDALQIVCGLGHDLDVAVIDVEHGHHALTLLTAISASREHFPVIAITGHGDKYVQALAYANGAVACLPKPVSAAQIGEALKRCTCRHDQPALVV